MADFPAIPLWTDAYLADTRHLTTIEHGAYLLLLMEAWRRPSKSLPDDDKLLARLAGVSAPEWTEMREVVMAFWKRDGRSQTWSQKRLSLEATYVRNKSKSQRDKARTRWNKTENDNATALPDGCRNDAPTPTPTPIVDIADAISTPRKRGGSKSEAEKPDDVKPETWADFQRLRKAKAAPITATVITGLRREAGKVGWTLEQAITECCERNWQGFKAEWIEGNRNGRNSQNNGRGDGNGLGVTANAALDFLADHGELRGQSPRPHADEQRALRGIVHALPNPNRRGRDGS